LLVGLYNPQVGVGDLRGRLLQAWETNASSVLGEIDPPTEHTQAVFDSLDIILEEAGYEAPTYLAAGDTMEQAKLHLKANLFLSRVAWDALVDRAEWGPVLREYIHYLAAQTGPPEDRIDVRETPEGLVEAGKALIAGVYRDADPELRGQGMAYLTVGSANMDYRSMVMDGEVMITVTGWSTIAGIMDFFILEGLTEWIDDQETLDQLLPPPSGFMRSIANLIKLAL
jgi:phosphatidylserine/phosphatidylglycerophosphate/cardiolipin synthase-like enzyme